MLIQRLALPLIIRLLPLSMVGSVLVVVVSYVFPAPAISFTLSVPFNFKTLYLMDMRTGLMRQLSNYSVTCCLEWSPDGTRIAFSTEEYQALVWDIRDGKVQSLTPPEYRIEINDWSPDGESIIAVGGTRSEESVDLYRLSLEEDRPTRLTFLYATKIIYADWSPDGQWIVFAAEIKLHWDIYRIKPDGSNFQQITNGQENSFVPAISPDGQQLVYASEQDGNRDLFIMNMNQNEPLRLTSTESNEGWSYWSPDGTRLYLMTDTNENRLWNLDVMKPDGTERQRLADQIALIGGPPALSPDGTQILLEIQHVDGSALYVMNTDGSNIHLVIEDDTVAPLNSDWMP